MATCEVCGNEIDATLTSCPHCGSNRSPQYKLVNQARFKVINIEKGMPLVRDAVKHFEGELQTAHAAGIKLLVLIHGYGSSGEGGAIKKALRQALHARQKDKQVKGILPGEDCGKNSGRSKNILRRFPDARKYLQRANPGITLVILG